MFTLNVAMRPSRPAALQATHPAPRSRHCNHVVAVVVVVDPPAIFSLCSGSWVFQTSALTTNLQRAQFESAQVA